MDKTLQAQKAALLKKLHHGPKILVLANAWDAISARIVEEIGFPAVATTSAGVAATLGYPDGQRVSRDEMLEVVARVARAVRVPVTADMEAGYGTTPAEMAETAQALIAAGAVGLNLEDVTGDDETSQVDVALQMEKIQAIREASAAAGVPLVVNARTDVYLLPIGPAETRFERTVERLRAYAKAGADCVFAPALEDAGTIEKLAKAVDAPLNILLMPGTPNLNELEKLGVARASIGSGLMRATLGTARKVAKAMFERRDDWSLFGEAVPYAELNRLLGRG
ncbi:MAG TPA: isocitrate lyase/phosphoenolpyruvate mutase family protein [Candidatus Acidoferrum sp.]|jgi:2-methylisocitrate lyase-like PEP mutase family enzyme|nr:isocitrate lyase/phosphoenolpyruvate mutase family protein [Candidatus Acidoferrum sp.]